MTGIKSVFTKIAVNDCQLIADCHEDINTDYYQEIV